MLWGAPLPDKVARPAIVAGLIARGLAASPDNPVLHAKLGYLHLDRHDFAAAAQSFEAALRCGSDAPDLPRLLARCRNYLGRHQAALEALRGDAAPAFERGRALMALGDAAAAERELRAVLAEDPDDPFACRMLCRLLRRGDRRGEMVALCEGLAARGGRNAQLLYNWGWALALADEDARARRLLPDADRILAGDLPVPLGFGDIDDFNRALAAEILEHPDRLSDFPQEDQANRGSRRVDNLFTGSRPDLIAALIHAFEQAVSGYRIVPREGFDPWPQARPVAARLRPWGLIQRGGDYEEGHIHSGGWLSGVYYVRVPAIVADAPEPGPGAIEFGPPTALAEAMPGAYPTVRYRPCEGMLLLAPSHYQHRTIPSGVDEDRISIAFDVVPERGAAPSSPAEFSAEA